MDRLDEHSHSNLYTHRAQLKTTRRVMVGGTTTGASTVQHEGTHGFVYCPLVVAAMVDAVGME